MTVAIALSALAGMAVGLRFTVLMSTPVILAAMGACAAIALHNGADVGALLGTVALSGLAVQVGYFCGSFAPLLAKPAPVPQEETRASHAGSYRFVSE
jgi:hypothetical protein